MIGGTLDSEGVGNEGGGVSEEGKTLGDAKFVIGDYVSCVVLPPLEDGSVAPVSLARREKHGGRENGRLGGERGGVGGAPGSGLRRERSVSGSISGSISGSVSGGGVEERREGAACPDAVKRRRQAALRVPGSLLPRRSGTLSLNLNMLQSRMRGPRGRAGRGSSKFTSGR